MVATTTSSPVAEPRTLYANDVSTPNSYVLAGSWPGTGSRVFFSRSMYSTSMSEMAVRSRGHQLTSFVSR